MNRKEFFFFFGLVDVFTFQFDCCTLVSILRAHGIENARNTNWISKNGRKESEKQKMVKHFKSNRLHQQHVNAIVTLTSINRDCK